MISNTLFVDRPAIGPSFTFNAHSARTRAATTFAQDNPRGTKHRRRNAWPHTTSVTKINPTLLQILNLDGYSFGLAIFVVEGVVLEERLGDDFTTAGQYCSVKQKHGKDGNRVRTRKGQGVALGPHFGPDAHQRRRGGPNIRATFTAKRRSS